MKKIALCLVIAGSLAGVGTAQAGCIGGAAAGGVAGHFAGHHAILGAVAGCAIGHHMAKKRRMQDQQPSGAAPGQNNT